MKKKKRKKSDVLFIYFVLGSNTSRKVTRSAMGRSVSSVGRCSVATSFVAGWAASMCRRIKWTQRWIVKQKPLFYSIVGTNNRKKEVNWFDEECSEWTATTSMSAAISREFWIVLVLERCSQSPILIRVEMAIDL